MAFKFGYPFPSGSYGAVVVAQIFLLKLALCFGSDLAAALQVAIEVADDLVWRAKPWKKGSGKTRAGDCKEMQDRDPVLEAGRRAIAKLETSKAQENKLACLERNRHVTLRTCGGTCAAAPTSSTTSWQLASRRSFARGQRPRPVSAASRGCACISVSCPHTNADELLSLLRGLSIVSFFMADAQSLSMAKDKGPTRSTKMERTATHSRSSKSVTSIAVILGLPPSVASD